MGYREPWNNWISIPGSRDADQEAASKGDPLGGLTPEQYVTAHAGYPQQGGSAQSTMPESSPLQDPLAALAERIGKLRGAIKWNDTVGAFSSAGSGFNQDMATQLGPLEQLYKSLMAQRHQGIAAQIAPQHMSGGGDPFSKLIAQQRQDEEMKRRFQDPYKKAREATINTALKLLQTQAPPVPKFKIPLV